MSDLSTQFYNRERKKMAEISNNLSYLEITCDKNIFKSDFKQFYLCDACATIFVFNFVKK